jgi:hypothetical protein
MAEPNLEYRIWPRGLEWRWQVMQVDGFTQFLTSGVAASGHAARIAALAFCLRYQDRPWET